MKYKHDTSLNVIHSMQSLTAWALSNQSIANWVMIVTESGACSAEITSRAFAVYLQSEHDARVLWKYQRWTHQWRQLKQTWYNLSELNFAQDWNPSCEPIVIPATWMRMDIDLDDQSRYQWGLTLWFKLVRNSWDRFGQQGGWLHFCSSTWNQKTKCQLIYEIYFTSHCW